MMIHTSKNLCKLPAGTVVKGKWHRHSYKIVKSLGQGANGVVYLAQGSTGLVALKISDNSSAIISEVNVLRRFSEVQGVALGPCLLDVDDWFHPYINRTVSFYVMEYIQGEDFLSFIHKKGKEWIAILMLQLLGDLEKLHAAGWVFGDLKPENLIVSGSVPRVRLVDVGGTTLRGRAIKEFTEFFDRGYWGMGSRKAEPSYDLFAVAMIMINACYPNRFEKKGNEKEQLRAAILSNSYLKKYEKVLLRAIEGQYDAADEMKKDLIQLIHQSSSRQGKRVENKQKHSRKKKRLLETAFLVIFVLFAYILYLYAQIL
ncbi:serine/threonine protein kinase [Thermolongibacillus altinsuensis]|uniref:serine/threonine protein kinase n=1 Tax=Thermolongibacillus altinsuensis TaxID=575256 RepID=UPI00242A2AE9|nr:protein kinase family protein [Thermolongibacillus altinsuensis]GMB10056.1 putative serine/threonine-protein kinase YabT [Thermolongibacillus altinsuensis]